MKEVSIYIVTGIKGRWKKNGYIAFCLEYYPRGKKDPETRISVEPVEDMTSNQSELEALIRALKRFKEKCSLSIYTESTYLNMGLGEQRMVDKWQKNGWKTGKNVSVKNEDKWKQLLNLLVGNEYTIFLNQSNAYAEMLHEKVKMKGEIKNV